MADEFGRLTALALAVALTAAFAVAEAPPVLGQTGPSCSSHASLTRPPDTIRVLRRKSGRITTVNFRKYVVTVMGKEWPSYLPQPVIEAGAVAVKQYAWFHTVYTSRSANGRCFDVKDGTGDQLYKPGRARIRPDHYRALDATWGVSLRKDGQFFMTGYRRGDKVRCGHDATGWKLYARSATQCAYHGAGWREDPAHLLRTITVIRGRRRRGRPFERSGRPAIDQSGRPDHRGPAVERSMDRPSSKPRPVDSAGSCSARSGCDR